MLWPSYETFSGLCDVFFLAKKGLFDGNFTAANLEISNPFKNCSVYITISLLQLSNEGKILMQMCRMIAFN